MKSNGILKFLIFIIIFSLALQAQKSRYYSLSGFIFDKTSGEALIGANIMVKGHTIGASTNVSGFFVIPEIPAGKQTLIVSYIGYKTLSVDYDISKNYQNIKINLDPESVTTEEVVVSGDSIRIADKLFSKPVSKINLTQKQVNQIPRVVEADLLRALQTMPGITSLSDFSSALYIRGGTPDQNLYMIDGTDVYNPEHAFGLFSTFNTNAIKKVELSKGGFTSNYGGRLSSVLDVTNLDGNRNKFEGVFNLSLLSGSTTLQAPIGSIGSISASFRRTYIDFTLSKWVKDVPDYYFYDGNVKAFLDLSERDKLTISYFHGKDNLKFLLDKDKKDSFGFDYVWGNTTGNINYKHIFNTKLYTSFWFTASEFKSDFDMPRIMDLREHNYLSDYTVKGLLEYYISNEVNVKLGAEHKWLKFIYTQDWEEGKVDVDKKREYTTAYTSLTWKPNPIWDIEVGLRYNRFNAHKVIQNFEPRFLMKYRLNETSTLKLAGGMYSQYLNRIPRMFFASIWTATDEYTKESTSRHLILGYQKEVADLFELEIEAYLKDYKNIHQFNHNFGSLVRPDEFSDKQLPVYKSTNKLFDSGDAYSYGVEVLLRKDLGAITGWVSYSFGKTFFKFSELNNNNEFRARHSRNHTVNFVLNSDLESLFSGKLFSKALNNSSSKWTLGVNFIYSTGQPLTLASSTYLVQSVPDFSDHNITGENMPGLKKYPDEINSFDLPAYTRLDLSLTYEKDYGSWSIAPYIQIFNLGNRKNLWFIQYENKTENGKTTQKIEKVNMMPLLPSIGITVKF